MDAPTDHERVWFAIMATLLPDLESDDENRLLQSAIIECDEDASSDEGGHFGRMIRNHSQQVAR